MRQVKHVGLILATILVAWGCNENSTKPQPKQSIQEVRPESTQQERVQTPNQQDAPAAGELDAYGREPGHAHYGHDHPRRDLDENGQIQQGSPVQTQQAPASGEPDKYGRKPGDAHYGHDHPLLEEELNNQPQ